MAIRKMVLVPTAETHDRYLRPHSELTERGQRLAAAAGLEFHPDWFASALIYTCPYVASSQTTRAVLGPARKLVFADPLLRPQSLGDLPDHLIDQSFDSPGRRRLGFYYQHPGGESEAQVYDRIASFLNFLVWKSDRDGVNNVLIVASPTVLACVYMRMQGMPPDQFDRITIRQVVQFHRNTDNTVFNVSGVTL